MTHEGNSFGDRLRTELSAFDERTRLRHAHEQSRKNQAKQFERDIEAKKRILQPKVAEVIKRDASDFASVMRERNVTSQVEAKAGRVKKLAGYEGVFKRTPYYIDIPITKSVWLLTRGITHGSTERRLWGHGLYIWTEIEESRGLALDSDGQLHVYKSVASVSKSEEGGPPFKGPVFPKIDKASINIDGIREPIHLEAVATYDDIAPLESLSVEGESVQDQPIAVNIRQRMIMLAQQ